MTAPKLTKAQREALEFIAKDQSEKWSVSWEEEVCTSYMGKRLASLGMVDRFQPGRVTAPMQLRLTDAGRAALKDGAK